MDMSIRAEVMAAEMSSHIFLLAMAMSRWLATSEKKPSQESMLASGLTMMSTISTTSVLRNERREGI